MRVHKLLPNYLLQGDGSVIEKETGEFISIYEKGQYRLQTSEKVFLETKGKEIELIRRFAPADIVKLYSVADELLNGVSVSENSEKTPDDESVKAHLKPIEPHLTNCDELTDTSGDELTDTSSSKLTDDGYKFVINEHKFVTIQDAVDELKMSRSTIERRIKSDEFPNYYKIE